MQVRRDYWLNRRRKRPFVVQPSSCARHYSGQIDYLQILVVYRTGKLPV